MQETHDEFSSCAGEYNRLLSMAVDASNDSGVSCDEVVQAINEQIDPAAIPVCESPANLGTVVAYARRAVLGDMTVRMQRGDHIAFDDLSKVFGPLIRSKAMRQMSGDRIAYRGETVSDLVQSMIGHIIEYNDDGRLENKRGRDSLGGLMNIILKRAASKKKRRARLDVFARIHHHANRVRQKSAIDQIEYADFVEYALLRGKRELNDLGYKVLCARLRNPEDSLRTLSRDIEIPYNEIKNSWARQVKPYLKALWRDSVW